MFWPSNVTEEVLEWNRELALSLIVIDVFLGIYVLLGVLGNLMIIYIYQVRMKVKLDDRIFILALALVDIVVCVTGPAFSFTRNILPVAFYGNVLCKIMWFFTKGMNAVSVVLILVIGVQRYLIICRPFGVQMNNRSKKIILAGSIIICFLGHAPIFIFYGEIPVINLSRNITGRRCGRIHDEESPVAVSGYWYLVSIFILAVGTLGLIAILYTLIGRRVYKRIKRRDRKGSSAVNTTDTDPVSETTTEIDPMNSKDSNNVRSSKTSTKTSPSPKKEPHSRSRRRSSSTTLKNWREKHRYSIMFSLISGICIVTYIPTLIVNLAVNLDSVEFWNYTSPSLREFYLYLFQVYIFNHVANPFVYGFFDSAFRQEMKYIFFRKN